MTRFNPFKAIAFTLALAGIGLTAPNADAGSRDKSHYRSSDHYQREYNRGHHYDHNRHYRSSSEHRYWRNHDRHSNEGLSFSIRLGSSDHYSHSSTRVSYHSSRGYDRHYSHPHSRTYSRSSCDIQPVRKVVVESRGYWKRVYVPAVYETRYYACGTPYRVCTRASYYKRVWVSGGYHH